MSITINGGTTVNGGVTVKAAPAIMLIHQDQFDHNQGTNTNTINGFIQSFTGATIIELTQEQQDYINALSGPPVDYILLDGNWGVGSTDHSPNTAVVLISVNYGVTGWQYCQLLPLGSSAFNEYSVYEGNWNYPFSALTLSDWG